MKRDKFFGTDYFQRLNKYWNAANYLSVAQLYLLKNPLLKRSLCKEDIKQKIVGHWGTVPGQNFIYAHCNRIIKKYDLDMILISGPGHGGNFFVANSYLEGTYSEIYPKISQDEAGLERLCKQFSFAGGIPSHVAPETPGSINEGGELGYSLCHGYGAIFDNPNLIATVIVGDGEAETGPLATSWHCNKFVNPKTDGAVLPILHLNGYKISNPAILSRISKKELKSLFVGYGYKPHFVEGCEPLKMHASMAKVMDICIREIKKIQSLARVSGVLKRPIWPMIILKTPKGWTGPKKVNGQKIEGSFRAHQVPLSIKSEKDLLELEEWLKSYEPQHLFDDNGKLKKEILDILPSGARRISANPNANGGMLLKEMILPSLKDYAIKFNHRGQYKTQDMLELSGYIRDLFKLNKTNNNYRIFSPDEAMSNRLYHAFEAENRTFNIEKNNEDENLSIDGRIMDSFLSEHVCEGLLEGYLLTGRHGMFNSYEAFIRIVDSMVSQHAKWLKVCNELSWRKPISSLNLVLTSNVWQQDHNGFTHQDPGFLDHLNNKTADVVRMYLPPDANCLLSCFDHCAKSKNYINVIVASKQPSLQWLSMNEAIDHCTRGLGEWKFASINDSENPDLIMACCGDTPTLESLAATKILNQYLPSLNIKFVNVVDLMKLVNSTTHPHGLSDAEYEQIFTKNKPIIFNFHGYPHLIHQLTYTRANRNLHVSGYMEEGTITTSFDMRVKNKIDRYDLVKKAVKYLQLDENIKAKIVKDMTEKLEEHKKYIVKFGVDLPEISNWQW